MQNISSSLTFFHKFVAPALFAFGLINMFLIYGRARYADPNGPYIVPIFSVAILAWTIYLSWGLKKVSIYGDKLYVSNYRREIAVPLSEIIAVDGNIWTRPQRITIRFRTPTEFGSKIVFLAKYRWFNGWSIDPIVDQLRSLADSQSFTGYLTPPPPR
ncbi:MAG TPA: hypothetical protein VGI80_00965 [Pyrinomonadaceae bacterium]